MHQDAGFRVLRFDHFGRGFSYPLTEPFDDNMYVETLHALLFGVLGKGIADKKVTLIGHSMGGAVCVAFAASHPELVEGLVLLAPSGFSGKPFPVKVKTCGSE